MNKLTKLIVRSPFVIGFASAHEAGAEESKGFASKADNHFSLKFITQDFPLIVLSYVAGLAAQLISPEPLTNVWYGEKCESNEWDYKK